MEEERDEGLANDDGEEESGAVEYGPPMSQALNPSSIGLSFLVEGETEQIVVRLTWGDYNSEEVLEEALSDTSESDPNGTSEEEEGQTVRRRPRLQWVRTPQDSGSVTVELKPDEGLQNAMIERGNGVAVEHLSRTLGDKIAVSVFLVNRREGGETGRPPVDRWVFQPALTVGSASGQPVFVPRELEPQLAHSDRDIESNRLLFRQRREFAIGHGCSPGWDTVPRGDRASRIHSEMIPVHELLKVEALAVERTGLEMSALGVVESGDELRQLLMPLLDGYESWIAEKRRAVEVLPDELQAVASLHLEECTVSLQRMRKGVELLTGDVEALQAFRFANRAMLLQRSHSSWSSLRRRGTANAPSEPTMEGRWRPFQLAFILVNLEGLIDVRSEDRQIGDLLWFPTGGGKTEAYLGLAAFTMSLRRRRQIAGMRSDAGLSVLMRYTLRLLTIQQFQRAATLICACEKLRQEDRDTWGEYRFSIGLWLGMNGTPNGHAESRRILNRLKKNESEEGANPCVLESCPWCGEPLSPADYWIDRNAFRTRVACSREACLFSRQNNDVGLPVLVVDEEIYRECPSRMPRNMRPVGSVVLKCWATETKLTPCSLNRSIIFMKSSSDRDRRSIL